MNIEESRQRMIYFGDDELKDRGFARGANIIFGHFRDEDQPGSQIWIDRESRRLRVSNWTTFGPYLFGNDLLNNGRSLGEIFFYDKAQISKEGHVGLKERKN